MNLYSSLPLQVEDSATGTILVEESVTVTIGPSVIRNNRLTYCDNWSGSAAGGEGVTIDVWDIGSLPDGAVIDIRYKA